MNQHAAEAASQLHINGSRTFAGDVRAQSIGIAGQGRFRGEVRADKFSSFGSCIVESSCTVQQLACAGHGRFHSVAAERISATGSFRANTTVKAELFHAKGIIHIGDSLTADEVQLALKGKSFIRNLTVKGKLEIRADRLSILNLLRLRKRILICTVVNGANMDIEHVEAELVVGDEIRIGAGCAIREVRYTKSLSISPNAVVKHAVQISR